jgi:PPK2 family polyphosphate:nucleotide phosphotransferase
MKRYLVQPGEIISLKEMDPNDISAIRWTKDEGESQLKAINERLEDLQELLYVEHRHRLLIVLQGMDTSGKDGVIRHVFDGVNPQGVKVASFKVPTQEELDHDYLWRIHRYTPGKGEIVIFNRSHYEDCLVVRVHNLIPRDNWEKRFAQISEFERMLAEEGTTIIKFFLNIDREEQKKRLQARLDDPRKRWKFNPGDVEERKYWDDYMKAY